MSKKKVLSEFTILCQAAFIAILGHMRWTPLSDVVLTPKGTKPATKGLSSSGYTSEYGRTRIGAKPTRKLALKGL